MEQNTNIESGPEQGIDLSEGAELVGTTAKQTKLVEGLLMGMNRTQAARHAGYEGEGVQLRSTASQACRSDKVLALLSWAESRGKGTPDAPGDRDELRRILWRHARSKDRSMSIKAAEALERLMRQDAEARRQEAVEDPITLLKRIAELDLALAVRLARKKGVNWEPENAEQIRTCPHCGQLYRHDAAPRANGHAVEAVAT
jgi:hypothetical protein